MRRFRGAPNYRCAIGVLGLLGCLPGSAPAHSAQERPSSAVTGESGSGLTDAAAGVDWFGDLDYLAAVLPRVHANAYHTVSPESFDRAVRGLAERLSGLSAAEVRVELAGLVARIGDGHTRVNLLGPGEGGVPAAPDSGFVPVPIRLYWFSDGLHVRSASEAHRELVGARLVRVGAVSAEEAAERVRPFMHRDNAMTTRLGVPWLLVRPAFLHAAGVIDGLGSVPMEFETPAGERLRRQLRPIPEADAGAVDAYRAPEGERPLWLRDADRPYWLDSIGEEGTLYVRFDAVVDGPDEDLAAFAARLEERLARGDVRRVIVDLRQNDGGNYVLALPLLEVLQRFEERRGPGSLFAMIGRATFSAAAVFAALLEDRTDAIFVGEPTGARPNTYGDLDTFTLPSSRLVVAYSRRYFQAAGPYDQRPWIDPDLTAELSFDDYTAGRDPGLAAIKAYRPGGSLGDSLVAVARRGSVEDALAAYREFIARPERRYYWAAAALERLGVHYWRAEDWASSLAVWRRLALDYPELAEGHENLAETYQAMGDRAAAVEALLASLRVDPRNPDAVELVSELCGYEAVRSLLRVDGSDTEAGTAGACR